MTLVLRLSNSGLSFAMYPSSVVQTGVKSLGCEKRIAHLSPIHSWKRIFPSVVSAVKSGASSPMRTAIFASIIVAGSAQGAPCWRIRPEVSEFPLNVAGQKNYTPPVATNEAGRPERSPTVILFAEMRGFTGVSDMLDPGVVL